MKAHYHIAKAAHRLTVFASVEYPVREPPATIVINGDTYVRVDAGLAEDAQSIVRSVILGESASRAVERIEALCLARANMGEGVV